MDLKVGDKIVLMYMEGETSVTPGTKGTVKKIDRDPFVDNEFIISVNWDNGSSLSLLSSTDIWKKVSEKQNIKEDNDSLSASVIRNRDIFGVVKWKKLLDFLYKIRESGIVNMFGVAPLLYAGRDHIDRYYGEGREDDENFQEVLESADEAKSIFIQGLLSWMEKNKKGIDDIDKINSYARQLAKKIVDLYVSIPMDRD